MAENHDVVTLSTGAFARMAAVDDSAPQEASWADLLSAALDETGGPLTDDETSWADSVLARSVLAQARQ